MPKGGAIMKRAILAAALSVTPALLSTGNAAAQAKAEYGTEVCVNASGAEDAKRLFPNARIHVVPDSPDRDKNGWRIVVGTVDANGGIHTDAEELKQRTRERGYRWTGE
jgi:hypothetical protein